MAINIKKEITLTADILDSDGNPVYTMSTMVSGDGTLPLMTTTLKAQAPVSYTDLGVPVYSDVSDDDITQATQDFMARAIKEQKALTVENGGDPSTVNSNKSEVVN